MEVLTRKPGRRVANLLRIAAVAFLLVSGRPAQAVTIDFENLPALPPQPNNFADAGAMQVLNVAGIVISGGVVIGNPLFLSAFPLQGTPPNAYGTSDLADPSLLPTITMTMPATLIATSISAVLFNGQTFAEDYLASAYSGSALVDSQLFPGMPANFDQGTRQLFVTSTAAMPITLLTITSPNVGANGWDFFVDTVEVQVIPEASSMLLATAGFACLLHRASKKRRKS